MVSCEKAGGVLGRCTSQGRNAGETATCQCRWAGDKVVASGGRVRTKIGLSTGVICNNAYLTHRNRIESVTTTTLLGILGILREEKREEAHRN